MSIKKALIGLIVIVISMLILSGTICETVSYVQKNQSESEDNMPSIPKVRVGSTDYDVKDAQARQKVQSLRPLLDNVVYFGLLFDITNKYINQANTLVDAPGWDTCSEYLPVSSNVTYYLSTTSSVFVCFYDSSKNVITSGGSRSGGVITIPSDNIAYMRISIAHNLTNNFYITADKLYQKAAFNTALYHPTFDIKGKYINQANVLVDAAGWDTSSEYLSVSSDKTYYLSSTSSVFVCFYSADGTVITSGGARSGGVITIPSDNIAYMRISTMHALTESFSISSILNFAATPKEIYVGAGQQFTTLRAGIAEAVKTQNTKVYVLPGEYDLLEEFATEISEHQGLDSDGHCGIKIYNGVHVIFYEGAVVTALFENDDQWVGQHFSPFLISHTYSANGSFTLENVVIEASKCRYCVHDEMSGQGKGIHKYINCRMKYTAGSGGMNACIGGGLGGNTVITIEGGQYETIVQGSTGSTAISYHNGQINQTHNSIHIRNVYISDDNRFRFICLGPSTDVSPVFISGCHEGYPTVLVENSNGDVQNMSVTEYCCEVENED